MKQTYDKRTYFDVDPVISVLWETGCEKHPDCLTCKGIPLSECPAEHPRLHKGGRRKVQDC